MSTKTLRRRLMQLERSAKITELEAQQRELPFEFPIDPVLLKGMEDEEEFIEYVESSRPDRNNFSKDPDTPEEAQAHARIAEIGKRIGCPPSYGFNDYWNDDDRWQDWEFDLAQWPLVRARMLAYRQSPEGRARMRLHDLLFNLALTKDSQLEEIERLLKLYPEPWANPNCTNHVRQMIDERGTPADRKRRLERDLRRLKAREEHRKLGKKSTYNPATERKVAKYFELLRAAGFINIPPPPDRISAW